MRYYVIFTGAGADKQYVKVSQGATMLVTEQKYASYYNDIVSADAEISYNLSEKFPEKIFLLEPVLT